MRKILLQGGQSLWERYEPNTFEVNTASDLTKLQKCHNKTRQVVAQLCRAKGLDVHPEKCHEKLEPGIVRRIRPEERINQGSRFPVTSRITPMELARWLQHGELKTWLEEIVLRARNLHIDIQERHLARDILSTRFVLAA